MKQDAEILWLEGIGSLFFSGAIACLSAYDMLLGAAAGLTFIGIALFRLANGFAEIDKAGKERKEREAKMREAKAREAEA